MDDIALKSESGFVISKLPCRGIKGTGLPTHLLSKSKRRSKVILESSLVVFSKDGVGVDESSRRMSCLTSELNYVCVYILITTRKVRKRSGSSTNHDDQALELGCECQQD